jgi:methionyl-tRNA synthetase
MDKPTSTQPAVAQPPGGHITFDEFKGVHLRTAEIIEAAKHPNADKLLVLQLAVAGERRQIVAGIAQHYKPEELVGKSIVIVANLKPAIIRGVESNGMLLAASNDGTLRLLTTDGPLPSGSGIG